MKNSANPFCEVDFFISCKTILAFPQSISVCSTEDSSSKTMQLQPRLSEFLQTMFSICAKRLKMMVLCRTLIQHIPRRNGERRGGDLVVRYWSALRSQVHAVQRRPQRWKLIMKSPILTPRNPVQHVPMPIFWKPLLATYAILSSIERIYF